MGINRSHAKMAVLAAASATALLGSGILAQSLPDIKSLPELGLDLVLDLADHPAVGLPWVGRLTPKGEFVFYDARFRRVMIMPLDGSAAREVGSFGEGPGEYQSILDIWLDEDGILVLDIRGRLIEYGWDGVMRREVKLPRSHERILGRRGEVVYLVGRSVSPEDFFDKTVVRWHEGGEAVELFKMKADIMRTRASTPDGKALPGGLFTLSEPAFALLEDGFAAAADPAYRILLFDLQGMVRSTWDFDAPEPEFTGRLFAGYQGKRSAYAVRDIFDVAGSLAVVGNFYRGGRPRLDCFGPDGKLTSSWLIPLVCEAPFSRCQIEEGHIVHFSSDEGCRIYRILSRM